MVRNIVYGDGRADRGVAGRRARGRVGCWMAWWVGNWCLMMGRLAGAWPGGGSGLVSGVGWRGGDGR